MINGVNNNEDIKIVVIGVGGGGGNAVNNMVASANAKQVKFVVVNTDGQDIEKSNAESRILITTKNKNNAGLGAGAKPEVGADAAENSLDTIAKELEGANLCFISAGLGGGTGTGAAPVIADFAKNQLGITTVAVVTRPFSWEGKKRENNAKEGLAKLLEATDALIEIPNDRIVGMSGKKTSLKEAFKAADDVLRDGVLGITDLITKTGLINLDFADVQAIVKEAGKSHMGIGTHFTSGSEDENAVVQALLKAIESPLLETTIDGARKIIVNYASSEELSMLHIAEANQMVYDKADEDVNLIWGAATDESLPQGEVKVTIIAAEFNNDATINQPSSLYDAPQTRANAQSTSVQNTSIESNTPYNYVGTGVGLNQSTMNNAQETVSNVQQANSNVATPSQEPTPVVPRAFDPNKFKSMFSRKN